MNLVPVTSEFRTVLGQAVYKGWKKIALILLMFMHVSSVLSSYSTVSGVHWM